MNWNLGFVVFLVNKFLKDLIHTCHYVRPSKFTEVINNHYSMHEASISSFVCENNYTVLMFSGRSRPSDKGWPGHPDLEISGVGARLKISLFWPFGPPRAPPLDPPLNACIRK